MNSSNDVIKYWKYDMSCMKMVCDYKVHREALSTGMNLLHGKFPKKFRSNFPNFRIYSINSYFIIITATVRLLYSSGS